MNAGFSYHAVGRGQPRKFVLQSPEYRHCGRNVSPKRGQWTWQPCGRRISGAWRRSQLAAVLHPQRRCLEVATGHIGWSAVVMTVALSLDYRVCAIAPGAKIVASPCPRL
jgi:hypothetical protein